MPTVLVPLAEGSEELEAISITNPLRRAGVDVTIAAIGGNRNVKCARGTEIVCDDVLENCVSKEWDMVVLPGGMPGAKNMHECSALVDLLKKRKAGTQKIAAICASPAVVFAQNGLLNDKGTCYPAQGFLDMMGEKRVEENVVVDGEVITSIGPGTALEFGLKLIEQVVSKEKMLEVASGMKFQGKLE